MPGKNIDILLIGTRSSVPTGQSISFEMLLSYLEDIGINYAVVDITPSNVTSPKRRGGVFSWRRALAIVRILPVYFFYLLGSRPTVYLLMGQSRVAFIRDSLFIWSASLMRNRIVAHLKGGNYDAFYADQSSWIQWFIRKTLSNVGSLIVLSESLKKCFKFLPDAEDKLFVVPNGLPITADDMQPSNLEHGEPINILYLSNMIETKGYWELLQACRILKSYDLPFRCHFCGKFRASSDDTQFDLAQVAQDAFLQAIQDWNLTEEVKWLGIVRGEKKTAQLQWAHVFVLPTRYVNEGQPVSIIEALAFGKVIISTNYRAIPDMVSHHYNGFLVKGDLPKEIAKCIESLWKNPTEITRMGRNSLLLYQNNFTQEEHLNKLLGIIKGY
jgi:glycosyltransferase involved in cell wall biosynthesis